MIRYLTEEVAPQSGGHFFCFFPNNSDTIHDSGAIACHYIAFNVLLLPGATYAIYVCSYIPHDANMPYWNFFETFPKYRIGRLSAPCYTYVGTVIRSTAWITPACAAHYLIGPYDYHNLHTPFTYVAITWCEHDIYWNLLKLSRNFSKIKKRQLSAPYSIRRNSSTNHCLNHAWLMVERKPIA